jgi:hypothetical protein
MAGRGCLRPLHRGHDENPRVEFDIRRILNIMKPARAGTRRFLPTSPFQAPPDPPPAEQFAVQDQVTHDKHGLGRVISIENDTALIIDFGTQKVRIITPCAKLTKLLAAPGPMRARRRDRSRRSRRLLVAAACSPSGSVEGMDKSERDSLIDDLWEMHGKLELWGGAKMDAADREELANARQLIRNVLNRQLGVNYLESRPFKAR